MQDMLPGQRHHLVSSRTYAEEIAYLLVDLTEPCEQMGLTVTQANEN